MAESWWTHTRQVLYEVNWQSCSDLHFAIWNSDHGRRQFAFLSVARDSTSWPRESHLNILNQKKNEKKREGKKREKLPLFWLKICSGLWFFMHIWSRCWQPWTAAQRFQTLIETNGRLLWQSNNDKHVAGQCPSFTNTSSLLRLLCLD